MGDRCAAGGGGPCPRGGLPTRRDEYWKYTDPSTLTQGAAPKAAVFHDTDEKPLFDGIDRLKIVFVDGVFDPAQSTISRSKG
jgi:Fe-S cluster assembly protein SufD